MTLQQIRTRVDNFLADVWVNRIVPKQEIFFSRHGRYAQVLVSPEVIPIDGGDDTFVYRTPSDEQFFDFEFTIDTPIHAQLEIHNHDSGNEHGFTAHVYVQVNDKIYHRAKNYLFGSEDIPWHEVTHSVI